MKKVLAALAVMVTVAMVPVHAVDDKTVSFERLQNIRVLAPANAPGAMIIYVSDRSGWTAGDEQFVQALREDGSLVLAVDFKAYAQQLDAHDGECLYVVGELTDLGQQAQRLLGIQSYMQPIVVGSGEGATFAYATIADSPPNTLGGAVGVGFENHMRLRLPFCPGARATPLEGARGFSYGFDIKLPEPAVLLVPPMKLLHVDAEVGERDDIRVEELDPRDRIGQTIDAINILAAEAQPFGDLPAVDLPAKGAPRAVAILVSGDGGWRDIDKQMGEWLAAQGVHLVGLDALLYFWSQRTPEEVARDVTALLHDADPERKLPIMLLGYSFGADALPLAWPLLDADIRARTKILGLMGPGRTTSLQVTVSGWLGYSGGDHQIVPAIAALPRDITLCVHGRDDKDASCAEPALAAIPRHETPGGHHFDGDYIAIARMFLNRVK